MKTLSNFSCWVVTEGMAGTENQCIGVAEALNLSPHIIKTGLKQPWSTLSPWLGFETSSTFEKPLTAPWPDLLITSGRKAVAVARYIKKKSGGKTFTVHLQDPRVDPAQFDLVAVPYHDPTRGENVIVTDTAPNKITDQKLNEEKKVFQNLADYRSPRIAVLMGGKSKAYDMTRDVVLGLIDQLKKVQNDLQASLFITASRRTGDENMKLLQDAFPMNNTTYFWDGNGQNPYIAYLGYADYILVTADSVSMISDALSTGKPTYIIPLEGGARRIDLFHKHILEKGYARKFGGELEDYSYDPVRESERIASEIRNKIDISSE